MEFRCGHGEHLAHDSTSSIVTYRLSKKTTDIQDSVAPREAIWIIQTPDLRLEKVLVELDFFIALGRDMEFSVHACLLGPR